MKLGYIQLSAILAIGMLLWGCGNTEQQPLQVASNTYQEEALPPESETLAEDDYWAKDNFDLQRVGPVLRRSRNVEEFERYLNEDDGINNLDLNGDGYADYISVDEYGYDEDPNQRGLSLYSRFGPDLVQEIARVIFYRDEPNYPGSRVMLYGDERIYGDDYYYETNWLDQTIGIVSALFSDREPYRSPYYYDNYPDWYEPYYIDETPIYRTRIERLYPEPVFIYTTEPTFIDRVRIRSPYDGKWIDRVYARLAKPTREQEKFLRSNRVPPARGRRDMTDGPGFSEDAPGQRKKVEGEQSANPGRGNPERGNPDKAGRGNPNKPDKADKDRGGPPPKSDRGGPPRDNPGRGNPAKGNPNKPDKPQNAGNPNKGGGNPDKGGGNKGKGGGKGKGKP